MVLPVIEANKVYKRYDIKADYVLKGIDFTVASGDFVTIMGPSGSGKTTLLNCISGLDIISKGNIKIDGNVISTMTTKQLATFRYESLGFVFQNGNLINTMNIFDNIATPLTLAKVKPSIIVEKVKDVAKALGITEILDSYPTMCSGGQNQRVAIARAMINNPKIIIADEPTGNLDSKNSKEILDILCELNAQGTTIIMVTHDSMIASFSKKMYYLRDGEIHEQVLFHDSQMKFFEDISKITMEDSLLRMVSKT